MVSKNKARCTGCPISYALDTFGDRWSLLIVRDILIKGYQTYSEFQLSDEKIATNILRDRLRELEEFGIITKSKDPNNGRRVLYKLTTKGADIAPLMIEMVRWSAKYDPDTLAKASTLEKIEHDKEGFIEGLKAQVKLRE
ncbi:MAG: helix-turn-helix domain-containing protein [Cycloclasticus sp.]|jgi:DNA-binding HxlR family transcriptional regulator|nr:helix-turn-helix domain-containing protein [Cycloclasticus sp.]